MKKRIFSLALAAVMTMSLGTSAFATDRVITEADMDTDTYEWENTDTLEGAGTTYYIDTEKYSVKLPTAVSFNFTVDPMGLAAITASGKLADLSGGTIIGATPASFINNSAQPIKLTAKVKAVAPDSVLIADPELVESPGTVPAPVPPENVLLYVEPSKVDLGKSTAAYSASKAGFVLGASAITLDFNLPAASYTVTKASNAYTMAADANTGHGTALRVGGYVNSHADWLAYTGATPAKTIGIEVLFTFAKDTTVYTTGDANATPPVANDFDDSGAYGLLKATPAHTFIDVNNGPSFAAASYASAVTPTANVVLNYTLGAETPLPTSITKVEFDYPAGTWAGTPAGTVTLTSGTGKAYTSTFTAGTGGTITLLTGTAGVLSSTYPAGTYTVRITFNNGATAETKLIKS